MLTILLVEDDPMISTILGFELTAKQNLKVIIASSIEEAKKEIASTAFDIIAVDACVPGGEPNTMELVEWIRNIGFTGPLIAISSREEFNRLLLRAGCNYSCIKDNLPGYIQSLTTTNTPGIS